MPALEPLLHIAPEPIVKYVVQQFAKVLPSAPEARKSFVESKGLQRVQELKGLNNGELNEYIEAINACYPPRMVEFCSPNFTQTLLKELDQFQPKA